MGDHPFFLGRYRFCPADDVRDTPECFVVRMSESQTQPRTGAAVYKRASRKNAPRQYACHFSSCGKVYSRHEHLQRHQLNHNPKEIFECDIENCNQRFVRADLLARHKKRHSSSYTPRNRTHGFIQPRPVVPITPPGGVPCSGGDADMSGDFPQRSTSTPERRHGTGLGIESPAAGGASSTDAARPVGAGADSLVTGNASSSFGARPGPLYTQSSSSMPRDAATILLSPESIISHSTSSFVPATRMSGHQEDVSQTQARSQPAPQASEWAAPPPINDLTACDTIQPTKSSAFYQPHPQHQPPALHLQHLQHSHHEHQHPQPSQHSQQQQHSRTPTLAHSLPDATPPMMPFSSLQFSDPAVQLRENFGVWLFNTEEMPAEFSVTDFPFVDSGLESPFNNSLHYDHDSLASQSNLDTPSYQVDSHDDIIGEFRYHELSRIYQSYCTKQSSTTVPTATHVGETPDGILAPNLELMHQCLFEFWEYISPRVPIIHQPTFSCNTCPPFLLLTMIALGAASYHGRSCLGNTAEFVAFADTIITHARFDILTLDEASPPVSLWVAQTLLLIEFYEKMYSSRRLHERSNIYHSVTLTLLRRGSPLIGRSGSESPPPGEMPPPSMATIPSAIKPSSGPDAQLQLSASHHHPQQPTEHLQQHQQQRATPVTQLQPQSQPQPLPQSNHPSSDLKTWWTRWAETEAMHRVVFAAFCFDITHAAMFGHVADMAPHEIRLPLPCDDNLWTATKPDDVRQLDANLRMYGVKPVFFLDGLKRALHGKEVKTHSFGRMIMMSGLLSVGWHLSHRETHLKWLDTTTPSIETKDNWRKILLKAFDKWKDSLDLVQGTGTTCNSLAGDPGIVATVSNAVMARHGGSSGPIQSASVLYHLAHISLHVDIVDCQVYAGAKRLLGRKVSTRDYTNVVSRMKAWATLPSTRHAIWHAFRLLHRVLVDPIRKDERKLHPLSGPSQMDLPRIESQIYSCRTDPDPHRPWIMYYAALSIWAFVRASSKGTVHSSAAVKNEGFGRPQFIQEQQRQYRQEQHHTQHQQQSQAAQSLQLHEHLHNPHVQSHVTSYQLLQDHQQSSLVHGSHFEHRLAQDATSYPLGQPRQSISTTGRSDGRVAAYLCRVAELPELDEAAALTLADGLPDLLEYLHNILSEAHSELLQEAHARLQVCRDIILDQSQ